MARPQGPNRLAGGGDRSELRPLRPDGNVSHDLPGTTIVGNHKGQFGGFNIVNPRPGTVHQFGTQRDILSARQRGWWVADPEVDGRPAWMMPSESSPDPPTPIDSAGNIFPEYTHLVTSESNYRRLSDEQQRASREQLSPSSAFLEGVSAEEYDTGGTERGQLSTRFALRDHGTSIMQGNETIEHLTPHGVVREEDL
jgi:hypothetical protein